MKQLSVFISWVFMPLLMPMYGLILALFLPTISLSATVEKGSMYMMPLAHKLYILMLYFVLTCLAPAFSLIILKKNNAVTSVELPIKEERKWPIILMAIYCCILGLFLYFQLPHAVLNHFIFTLPWAGFFCSCFALLINKWYKISLHAMGAGILFGFIVCYYQQQIIFPFGVLIAVPLCGGLIMSARVKLKVHSLEQVLTGYLVGTLLTILVLTLFTNLLLN